MVTASKASSVLHAESSASSGGLFGTEKAAVDAYTQGNVESIQRIAANRASGQYKILDVRINSRSVVNNSDVVKVYRVEGDANQRFIINSQGNVSLVPNKDTMLFLNIGDSQRAMDFLNQRASQSTFFNPTLKSFDADSSLLLKLRLRSIPQRFGRLYPDYAQIADPTKAADQFGIPSSMFDDVIPSIRPGSGMAY